MAPAKRLASQPETLSLTRRPLWAPNHAWLVRPLIAFSLRRMMMMGKVPCRLSLMEEEEAGCRYAESAPEAAPAPVTATLFTSSLDANAVNPPLSCRCCCHGCRQPATTQHDNQQPNPSRPLRHTPMCAD